MLDHKDLVCTALQKGDLVLKGQFLLGSNHTFLVEVRYAGRSFPAVYKPMRGEQPLWDFPPASLAGREVAAYIVSEALGFSMVPNTLLRDGPLGAGSLQQFIDYDPSVHYFSFKSADTQRLRPVALFDLLINNADRKGSHIIREKRTRRLFLIDHGLCFHAEDKLRTVIWDFAGEAFSPDLVNALSTIHIKLTESKEVKTALEEVILPEEIAAMQRRLENLLNHPVFPDPPEDRRSFPYPPL
jgi:hypothetical protein